MSAEPQDFYLIRLPFPVPPGFVRMSGYGPAKRFVAFHWMEDRDELAFEDGTARGIGHWKPYALLMTSRFVQRTLFPFELGSSQQRAWHRLLADRRERIFYAGHVKDVQRFMERAQVDLGEGAGGLPRGEPAWGGRQGSLSGGSQFEKSSDKTSVRPAGETEYLAFLKVWMSECV